MASAAAAASDALPQGSPVQLQGIWNTLSPQEKSAALLLLELDQKHLFEHWPAPGQDDDKKRRLLKQAALLDAQYPGGLRRYCSNAKKLLRESAAGDNPYDGWLPSVPEGERLDTHSPQYREFEEIGLHEAPYVGFILVAGGLGERLGYGGIKVELPAEITTETCYLQLYVQNILALQEKARSLTGKRDLVVPFAIMTSDDTHARTVELLRSHNNFGMAEGQLTLIKQEKVPAMLDNDAHFALEDNDKYEISTKPHGHGDMHMLMHSSRLARKWVEMGKRWVFFIQDTNGLVFRCVLAALGVSAQKKFDINSVTVPRRPGEAVGGICTLTAQDGHRMTINVEYNQLDPLLRKTVNPKGDVPDASGFSPYPGNCNVLVFNALMYADVLDRTDGSIPEFVNPKYAEGSKSVFKKPTRLECMMQDFPKLLAKDARVGFVQFERWTSFSAVKNDIATAIDKAKSTGFAESASSGEADIYAYGRKVLSLLPNVKIEEAKDKTLFAGVPTEVGARIVLHPSFALTQGDIRTRFNGGHAAESKQHGRDVVISARSTLVVVGDVVFDGLHLDGTLVVEAVPGAHVRINNITVKNDGWEFRPIDPKDGMVAEKYRIRGYVLNKKDQRVIRFDKPGQHTVDA